MAAVAVPLCGDVLAVRDGLVTSLSRAIADGDASLRGVPQALKAVLQHEAWRERRVERLGGHVVTFSRFADFVTTAPLEGLGADVPLVQRLLRDDPEALDLLDRALQNAPGRPAETVDDVNVRPDGNTRAYALRRLRKDRPDLHAEVLAGRLSPHRAMVAAGFRRQRTPLELATWSYGRLSPEERETFRAWLEMQPR